VIEGLQILGLSKNDVDALSSLYNYSSLTNFISSHMFDSYLGAGSLVFTEVYPSKATLSQYFHYFVFAKATTDVELLTSTDVQCMLVSNICQIVSI
jgi:hypothetical protein